MKEPLKIVYVATFPPRECGIATFTADLTGAMGYLLRSVIKSRVAAVNEDDVSRYHYPREVIFQIAQHSEQDYVKTAEKINAMDDVKIVNVQHEFGIFGGKYGSHIVSFLEALQKPSIVTFHSVLPSPDEALCGVVRAMAEKANGLTVMTHLSKEILIREYGIAQEKVSVIPHGIHSMPYRSSGKHKSAAVFSKRVNLLTFGFLSKGKGLEYVIEALPKVIQVFPDLMYMVLGVTHPNVLKEEGESYRNSLIQRVRELNLSSHVSFYNEYVSRNDLLRFLRAADIYISTSLDPNHTVSGTLSYALGSGKPVISTPFAQAKEVVTSELGILVNFRDSDSYAQALIKLLKDPLLREQIGKNAYFRTRNMTWENVALEYSKLFSKHSQEIAQVSEYKNTPHVNLKHMFRLTDDFGIIQFSWLSLPDVSSGYTLDDNARALTVACLCVGQLGRAFKTGSIDKKKNELLNRIEVYLRFIEFVLSEDGTFYNYVKSDRTMDVEFNQKENLEDANGRTLWALGVAASAESLPGEIKNKARVLLMKRMEKYKMFESPRAIAFYIKGLCLLLKTKEMDGKDFNRLLVDHCDKLVSLYRGVSSEDWQWFENYLTYSNAVLPEALLVGYQQAHHPEYLEIGIKTLSFLIQQTFIDRMYTPIGQDGWHRKDGKRRYFDQQPEDVSAMACALATAYSVTGDNAYQRRMHEAFNWFLGDNSLEQMVYDKTTGGCYDGVGEGNINLNQGAESTLSYLLARIAMMGQEAGSIS